MAELTKKEIIELAISRSEDLESLLSKVKSFCQQGIIKDQQMKVDFRKRINEHFGHKLSGDLSQEDSTFLEIVDYIQESMSMMYILGAQDTHQIFMEKINELNKENDSEKKES